MIKAFFPMKIASRATPEGLAGHMWPACHSLSTTALGHDFWTWNPSRSSKVSKDSDCSLLPNKNFSEILSSNILGPGEVGQGGLKVVHLWRHSQKICNPQPKNYFTSAD